MIEFKNGLLLLKGKYMIHGACPDVERPRRDAVICTSTAFWRMMVGLSLTKDKKEWSSHLSIQPTRCTMAMTTACTELGAELGCTP